jgi:large subunit ribosomal protein L23
MRDPYAIIKTMQVTEKGSRLGLANKYLFVVAPEANKHEIKRAVETLFKVKVARVNTMNCRGKLKRLRTARYGLTPDWKRAIVTLHPEHKIELG